MKRALYFLGGLCIGVGATFLFLRVRSQTTLFLTNSATSLHQLSASPGEKPAEPVPDLTARVEPRSIAADLQVLRAWTNGAHPELPEHKIHAILERWSAQDAHAALAFVASAARFPERNGALAIPLAELCKTDPDYVAGWIRNYDASGSDRVEITGAVVGMASSSAPANALRLAFDSDNPPNPHTIGSVIGVLAVTDPSLAMAHLQRLTGERRRYALGAMMSNWARKDPTRAIAWFNASGDDRKYAVHELVSACLSNALTPEQLLERVQCNTNDKGEMLEAMAREGVLVDARHFEGLSEQSRQSAVSVLAWRSFSRAPDEVLKLATTLLPAGGGQEVICGAWDDWVRTDRKAALDWARALSDRTIGEVLLRADRVRLLQDEEPEKAMTLISMLADPAEKREATRAVMTRLAHTNPSAAAEWLLQSDPNSSEEHLVGRVVSNYLEEDGPAAMEWITRLPRGPARDRALRAAAVHWSRREDMAFTDVALQAIADPARRLAATYQTFRRLVRSDAAAANLLLQEQGISAEVGESWKAISRED